MQNIRKIIVFFMVFFTLFLISCSKKEPTQEEKQKNEKSQPSIVTIEKELLPNSLVETIQIYKGMTLKETIAMIGMPRAHVGGVSHPFYLVWNMQDGRELNITFFDSNYKSFSEKLYNDEFVLEGEDPGTKQIYAWECLTPNEQKIVKDWCLNTCATKAFIHEMGKQDIVLFD